MLHDLKKRLYFVAAAYFAFWAKFVLWRWQPRIVVITGSTGKTTTLHLVEAQLGDKALYSHHANGAIGIPFHILGMPPNVPSKKHWPLYILAAPFHIFRRLPKQKLYIVEADCDRPHEGKFTGSFLKPEVTLWVSVFRTHSMNFDKLVKSHAFATHEDAIAYEFGNFPAETRQLVLANGDQPELVKQLERVKAGVSVKTFSLEAVKDYKIKDQKTHFTIDGQAIQLPGLHPREQGVSLQMINGLLDYLDMSLDPTYKHLEIPPGRSNFLVGKNNVTLLDSTYNTGLDGAIAVLGLFEHYPADHKWIVIGDIQEQGSLEKEEHEKLARVLAKQTVEQIVLLGKRSHAYTYPLLRQSLPEERVVSFENAKEVLDYLTAHLRGSEVVLFKGAQGLEGVIEQLLAKSTDAQYLVRREPIWVKRRQAWGLPK